VAPSNVIAAASADAAQVEIHWNSIPKAASYDIYRSAHHQPYGYVGSSPGAIYVDTAIDPNTTYLYEVRAADGAITGPLSAFDWATTVAFQDNPIVPGETAISAMHLQQLQTAVHAMESASGRSPSTFSTIAPGVPIRAIHIIELRFALNAALTALQVPTPSYTDPGLWVDTPITPAHIQELREPVK